MTTVCKAPVSSIPLIDNNKHVSVMYERTFDHYIKNCVKKHWPCFLNILSSIPKKYCKNDKDKNQYDELNSCVSYLQSYQRFGKQMHRSPWWNTITNFGLCHLIWQADNPGFWVIVIDPLPKGHWACRAIKEAPFITLLHMLWSKILE